MVEKQSNLEINIKAYLLLGPRWEFSCLFYIWKASLLDYQQSLDNWELNSKQQLDCPSCKSYKNKYLLGNCMHNILNWQIYFRKYLEKFNCKISGSNHDLYNHINHMCLKFLQKSLDWVILKSFTYFSNQIDIYGYFAWFPALDTLASRVYSRIVLYSQEVKKKIDAI